MIAFFLTLLGSITCCNIQAYNPADLAKAQRFSQTKENLAYANLSGANLSDLNLAGGQSLPCKPRTSNLIGASLTGARLEQIHICNNSIFKRCKFNTVKFINSKLIRYQFLHSSLRNLRVEGSDLTSAAFDNVRMRDFEIFNSNLSNTSYDN